MISGKYSKDSVNTLYSVFEDLDDKLRKATYPELKGEEKEKTAKGTIIAATTAWEQVFGSLSDPQVQKDIQATADALLEGTKKN